MAAELLNYTVADLCLGKPPLRRLSAVSSTVSDTLAALKSSPSGDPFVSIWACNCLDIDALISQELVKDHHHHHHKSCHLCLCVGRVCMVDIICYLCKQVNGSSSLGTSVALKAPVSVLLSKENKGIVKHVEPSSSLIEAIDLILQGAQHLVVPIKNPKSRKHLLTKPEYCWLTQEDLIRFFLSSIALFSPLPTLSIETLNLVTHEIPMLPFHSSATSAIEGISRSTPTQNSIAIIEEDDNALIREMSYCDETLVSAIMTLSGGNLTGYIDYGGPPEDLIRVVEERLREKNLGGLLEELSCNDDVVSCLSSSSSDEESTLTSKGRLARSSSSSTRMARRAEAIVCHRWSSLVAVMIQAIAHRVSYVCVVEEDSTVVGIVNFASILLVFREYLEDMV